MTTIVKSVQTEKCLYCNQTFILRWTCSTPELLVFIQSRRIHEEAKSKIVEHRNNCMREYIEAAYSSVIASYNMGLTPRSEDIKLLLGIAALYLSVMKSGVPKKKPIKVKDDIDYEAVSYNKAIDEFTAYLAQKLSGLEEVIYKNSEDNGGCGVVINIEQLLTAIRKHLEVEK